MVKEVEIAVPKDCLEKRVKAFGGLIGNTRFNDSNYPTRVSDIMHQQLMGCILSELPGIIPSMRLDEPRHQLIDDKYSLAAKYYKVFLHFKVGEKPAPGTNYNTRSLQFAEEDIPKITRAAKEIVEIIKANILAEQALDSVVTSY